MNLNDNRVMILKCDRYEVNMLKVKLKEGLKPWGGIEAFVKPGARVLLKANLLMAKRPEEVTTTHPAVVQAVSELVQEAQGKVIIGDSPGGPFNRALLQHVYRRTGMETVANATGASLNWDTGSFEQAFPGGKILKKIILGNYIKNVDLIINLPKLKAHGMTKMTAAVKNLFGAIPGLIKAEYHFKMQDVNSFSNVLIDIALAVAPTLNILDGIIGMEGEGPSGGIPKELNTILISPNFFALDVVVAALMRTDLEKMPTIKMAEERGFISKLKDVQLLGMELEELIPDSFESPEISANTKFFENYLPERFAKWMNRFFQPKPLFDNDLCIQCGVCIASCPPNIISMTDHGVKADLSACIRCFCCQELCPKKAVKIHRPFLGKLLFRS